MNIREKLQEALDLAFIIASAGFLGILALPTLIVAKLRKSGTTKILFHSWGLGSIASAIFLQLLVFKDILLQGYFLAMETRESVLLFEIFITCSSFIYFAYIYYTRPLREINKVCVRIKGEKEPKVIVHRRIEMPLEDNYGFFNNRTREIHVYDKNLVFNLVLEHEKVHWERRNKIINRFLNVFWVNDRRMRMIAAFLVILSVSSMVSKLLLSLPTEPLQVIVIVVLLLITACDFYEEHVATEEAKKRVRARSETLS